MLTNFANGSPNNERSAAKWRSGDNGSSRSRVFDRKNDLRWLGLTLCGVSAIVSLYSLLIVIAKVF